MMLEVYCTMGVVQFGMELYWKGQNLELDDLPASIASEYVFQWFRALLRSNVLEPQKN